MPIVYDEPLDTTKWAPVEFTLHTVANSTWRIDYPFAEMGKNDFFLIYDGLPESANLVRNHARYFVQSREPWAKFTVRPRDESKTVYVCRRITG